jgi:serine/threonine protein phosphatase 1
MPRLVRTIAIGDIHGCLTQFESLLDALQVRAQDRVVILGDFVDRGPDPAGVIKRILALGGDCDLTVLMGNHEQMMLQARESNAALREWRREGGDTTLRSYGGIRGTLREVPADHWRFLESELKPYLETETHVFVHATLEPGIPMEAQTDYTLRWQRCETTGPHESGKTIVCGHSSQKSGRPLNRGFLVCLDTFAHGGGPLTAMDVGSGRLWLAGADGSVARALISNFADE